MARKALDALAHCVSFNTLQTVGSFRRAKECRATARRWDRIQALAGFVEPELQHTELMPGLTGMDSR